MARYVLGAVGAVVGGYFGGPGGASAGWQVGYTVGTYVDPHDTKIDGARLDSLKVQDSTYGGGIPSIFGTIRTAGNVIWATPLEEHETSDTGKGGKGGDTTTQVSYTYTTNFALALCEGEIDEIVKVWADGKVLYENGECSRAAAVRVYTGSEEQLPDPLIEAIQGEGNAPAYRGTAYMVFEDLELADFGNRIPNLTALCVSGTRAVINLNVTPGDSRAAQVYGPGTMTPIVSEDGSVSLMGETSGKLSMRSYSVDNGDELHANSVDTKTLDTEAYGDDLRQSVSPSGNIALCAIDDDPGTDHKVDISVFDPESRTALASISTTLQTLSGWTIAGDNLEYLTANDFTVFGWLSNELLVVQASTSGGSLSRYCFLRFDGSSLTAVGHIDAPVARQALPTVPGFILTMNGTNLYSIYITDVSGVVSLGSEVSVCALNSAHFINSEISSISQNEYLLLGNNSSGALYGITLREVAHVLSASRDEDVLKSDAGIKFCGTWVKDRAHIAIIGVPATNDNVTYSETLIPDGAFVLKTDSVVIPISGSSGNIPRAACYYIDAARLDIILTLGSAVYYLTTYQYLGSSDVGSIVRTVCERSGYDASELDLSALYGVEVPGMMWQPSAGRTVIEPLQTFFPFDLIESDGFLKGVVRTSDVTMTISEDMLTASNEHQDPNDPPYTLVRVKELDLPKDFTLNYLDADREWQSGSQRASRQSGGGIASSSATLPIVMTPLQAKQISEQRLFTAWGERDSITFKLPVSFIGLDPSDVVAIGPLVVRIGSVKLTGGILECTATPIWTAAYTGGSSAADGGKSTTQPYIVPGDTMPFIIDIPPLRTADDAAGCYVAVGAAGDKWPGAHVLRAPNDIDYALFARTGSRVPYGTIATAIPSGPTETWDMGNTIDVVMEYGEISSVTELDILNGLNSAYVGREIIQFQNAELIAENTYRLSKLLRGRRGTEWAVGIHEDDEVAVALIPTGLVWKSLPLYELGVEFDYRAVTVGTHEDDTTTYPATVSGESIKPLSPVHIRGSRLADDLTISWVRRARMHPEWLDNVDVPLDEDSELYQIDILNGSTVVRTISVSAATTALYSAADQISDFGSVQSHILVRIYQLSSRIGRGHKGEATI